MALRADCGGVLCHTDADTASKTARRPPTIHPQRRKTAPAPAWGVMSIDRPKRTYDMTREVSAHRGGMVLPAGHVQRKRSAGSTAAQYMKTRMGNPFQTIAVMPSAAPDRNPSLHFPSSAPGAKRGARKRKGRPKCSPRKVSAAERGI